MTTTSPLARFAKGFWYSFSSFSFIRRHPSLYPFVVLPVVVNVASFGLVIYFGFDFFHRQVMARLPQGTAWYWLILNYFLVLLAAVVVMTLVFFTFAAVGSMIASPFNDVLSARAERLLGGGAGEAPFSLKRFFRESGLTLITEAKKVGLFVAGMALLLLLHLLPVAGFLLYPWLSVAWTAFFLVMEYTGYVFYRQQLGFSAQRRVIFRHAALMTGFGLGLFCLLAIPFVQFFCIPLGVVGAVRLLHEAGELGAAAAD